MTTDEVKSIIQAYYSRPIARVKDLKTGQFHVAFEDGAMSVYSKSQVKHMENDMLASYHEEKTRQMADYEDFSGNTREWI